MINFYYKDTEKMDLLNQKRKTRKTTEPCQSTAAAVLNVFSFLSSFFSIFIKKIVRGKSPKFPVN